MKRLLLISCVALVLGCGGRAYRPVCWQTSVLAAVVLETKGHPTRIVVTWAPKARAPHAQTQARINGEWVWFSCTAAEVYESGDESAGAPVVEVRTIEEALKWMPKRP